jgi:hypothetical protein
MRNISFSMTTAAFIGRRKTVTRRLGWSNIKPGDILMGVQKAQGLKKGEKVVKLGAIRVINVTHEALFMIYLHPGDCAREGFPDLDMREFIDMFCAHNRCTQNYYVNRIEFEYLDECRDCRCLIPAGSVVCGEHGGSI